MRRNGFTLIELMLVASIIGILVAISIPKFMDIGQAKIRKAEMERVEAQLKEDQKNADYHVKVMAGNQVVQEYFVEDVTYETETRIRLDLMNRKEKTIVIPSGYYLEVTEQ